MTEYDEVSISIFTLQSHFDVKTLPPLLRHDYVGTNEIPNIFRKVSTKVNFKFLPEDSTRIQQLDNSLGFRTNICLMDLLLIKESKGGYQCLWDRLMNGYVDTTYDMRTKCIVYFTQRDYDDILNWAKGEGKVFFDKLKTWPKYNGPHGQTIINDASSRRYISPY
jgi:hypothetical protein